MASVSLDDEDVARIADAVVARWRASTELADARPRGWMDSRAAAQYAGCSVHALHRATAAREVHFEQQTPSGKCWFKAEWIDAWRTGKS